VKRRCTGLSALSFVLLTAAVFIPLTGIYATNDGYYVGRFDGWHRNINAVGWLVRWLWAEVPGTRIDGLAIVWVALSIMPVRWLVVNELLARKRGRLGKSCRSCGYNLTGNLSGTCPECGVKVR
jgi:hypothetical protein